MPRPSRAVDFGAAQFLTGAHLPSQCPPDSGAEVVFAGRSNSGKSSALNLIARPGLARTGKTPGRTRQINFFTCGGNRRLVDLPGYGYADVRQSLRAHWGQAIGRYLEERNSLKGLILTMDIRRAIAEEERQLLEWCAGRNLPARLLLTKSDKLSRAAAGQKLRAAGEVLKKEFNFDAQIFSALKNHGRDEARKVIVQWLLESGGEG